MGRDPITWASIAGVDSITEYLDRGMHIPGTDQRHLGTDTEILAFADLFDCMVYIYNGHDDVLYPKQHE
ncbi:toxin-antitoxin system, toxin component, RelE domain protein [Ancylostoma duodenale]|uniref:Toxin-antitoxin system, toxin component, RelE domain protein n=1 Tax=Ancylostoma duodenale TaxID=51022 RepID=A0A0C2HCP8_9BILA|nr:toxin-antitoxin system, toxin component, RelE domain protein [Ancylostoma duodenale]